MLLASWNLNSIRAREERLLAWLEHRQPDVVCLQELKCTEDQFPFEAIEAAGYQAIVHGQKTYNGVAILSKSDPTDVSTGFGDGGDESQARVIAATIDGVRIISVYVPNGGAVYSKKFSGPENEQRAKEKYAAKIEWLRRLKHFLEAQGWKSSSAVVYQDNLSAVILESNGRGSSGNKTRHMHVRYFYIKDCIASGDVNIEHCPSESMIGDYFTNPFQGSKFKELRPAVLNL